MVGEGDEEVRGGSEVKLSEALAAAKASRQYHYDNCMGLQGCCDYEERADDLIDALEAQMEAQKKEADIILGLAELRRWGGSE